MKKITKLTPEQVAQIPIIRDEFLHHGLSTAPADFDAAEPPTVDGLPKNSKSTIAENLSPQKE